MPATRPRASFEPIPPDFDLKALVETTPNFSYVDRISVDMIDQQGFAAFEKLVLLHVVIGGKPLVIDGFEDRLDPWTFTPKWLRDNCGDKQENSRNLTVKETLPLTIGHYLNNMAMLTNQFFSKHGAYKESKRQRVYLKDIDCPPVWHDKLREHIPSALFYLNDSTGDIGGPGAVPDLNNNISGRRLGKGIARAGDLMSSLPTDMRADNLMCYIGHEGTYTPAHREMCASLGQNIMVGASGTVSEDGKPEKPGSSVWFMTESKDRHTVSEYWLSVLGHDIEVESHFAQVVAWKKAPFNVYVVEQRPGDFILIPPLAPHQVWNRGTRTMKIAWNRTTVETLEMALIEALPRSRIVCRDEQYKNKAIVYYTLQKYSGLLSLAQSQAAHLPQDAAQKLLSSSKIKALGKDFRRLLNMYKQILLSEMFNPDDRDNPKSIEYLPFDSNVTCAYCRGNVFNRFLSCPSCKDLLGHHSDDNEGDPYDVCMECYAMGRSCACMSELKWVEQFRWKELAAKYESWRRLIISLDAGEVNEKTPLSIVDERKKYGKKTLAEVCKEQLKGRPFKDVKKPNDEPKDEEGEEEEIIVDDNGMVKNIQQKKSKAWLKNNNPCHVCQKRHPNWKMAQCRSCERWWCYGTLFRGWDKMPTEIMEDQDWTCPHCVGICFAGVCRKDPKMQPYEPKGTLLGHDTRKVADARSVEALVDFSVSNLNWLREDDTTDRAASKRLRQAGAEAQKAKQLDPTLDADEEETVDQSRIQLEYSPGGDGIDPALGGAGAVRREGEYEDDDAFARKLQLVNSALPPSAAMVAEAPVNGSAPEGYTAVSHAGYVSPAANMYPQPEDAGRSYNYPGALRASNVEPVHASDDEMVDIRPSKRRRTQRGDEENGELEDIHMTKHPKAKRPRMSAAGFRSSDLADASASASRAKNEAQRQFEKEKERKTLEKAKSEGRFIIMQAALRNKKNIVKLPISGPRLVQLVAQQAAKAALTAGEEANAEHEVEEGAAQPELEEEEDGNDGILLKSDIAPKKTKDQMAYYKQRQQNGLIISGQTKKARVPVEKDDSYRAKGSHRAKGSQSTFSKAKVGGRPSAGEKTVPPRSRRNVEYEEVDIGTDEEDFENDSMFTSTGPSRSERRALNRHAGEGVGFPDELSSSYRDASDKSRPPRSKPAVSRSPAVRKPSQTAGKRPAMRPSAVNGISAAINITSDDEEDKEAPINTAANGNWMDVNDVVGHTVPSSAPASASPAVKKNIFGKPRRRPSSGNIAALQRQKVEEQNRLAKLQALEGEDDGVL